jgi:hypothetical protein
VIVAECTTIIRSAEMADLPFLVAMGQRFRAESSYAKYLADNPERMRELGLQLLALDSLLVAERDGIIAGMLGYVVHHHFISGEKVAGEVFWWMEPECRGEGLKLLEEFKRRARLAKAKYIHMIAPNERVARLYRHAHYDFVESVYQLAL